jgi:chromate transport protein ChrA
MNPCAPEIIIGMLIGCLVGAVIMYVVLYCRDVFEMSLYMRNLISLSALVLSIAVIVACLIYNHRQDEKLRRQMRDLDGQINKMLEKNR